MVCTDCSTSVHDALSALPGVVTNRLSLKRNLAVVRFDARKVDARKLAVAIDGAGFKAGNPVPSGR